LKISPKKSLVALTARLDLDVISDKTESLTSSSDFSVKNGHKDLEDFFSDDDES